MKILHITNELTQKNFSISSLILFISKFLYKKYQYNFLILAATFDSNLFKQHNINILNLKSWKEYFLNKKNLSQRIKDSEIVHIHGLWAPIQFISLVICIINKKVCFVHPHGMLLNEAIKSGGLIKLIFKKVSLYFLKLIIDNEIRFISITNQETKAIKKYFPKIQVTEISNPIPFEINNKKKKIFKKKMVYFGRIHPHKNIDLMIESFLKANLNTEWSLTIYGIRDDEKYYLKLLKKIENKENIEIKDPVFGAEKQDIMQEAWVNILVSKSEVLSLSILESSALGLPSLINENIETTGLESAVYGSKLNLETLSKKIIEVSNWTLSERTLKGQDISMIVKDKTSMEVISSKYNNLYEECKIDQRSKNNINDGNFVKEFSLLGLFKKDLNFFIVSSVYTFNLMFTSFLVVALVFLGHFSIAGEIGLITSFWISFTQIFSSNMKSIVVFEQNKNYAIITMAYRTTISALLFMSFYFFIPILYQFENLKLINVVSILILVQWVNEMSLVQYEIKNRINIFQKLNYINLFVVIICGITIYLLNFELLSNIILFYAFILFLSFTKNLITALKKIKNTSLKAVLDLNLKTLAFLSSFSLIISSFAWRVIIYNFFDKSLAGLFFACFSIGSFPGTLFNSVIGPTFIKQKIKISQKVKKILLALFLILIMIFVYSCNLLINQPIIDYLSNDFILFTTSISVIGSFFMIYAMFLRHKKIQDSFAQRTILFKRDIIYGYLIVALLPILYYVGGAVTVSFTFFLASLVALISYKFNYGIRTSN